MFSHVFIGVTDFDRAFRFYSPIMEALRLLLKFREEDRPWAGWVAAEEFVILWLVVPRGVLAEHQIQGTDDVRFACVILTDQHQRLSWWKGDLDLVPDRTVTLDRQPRCSRHLASRCPEYCTAEIGCF